jgi:NADPH2:quinone reductase
MPQMKAILVRATGGPEVLDAVEMSRQAPGTGQVLLRVEAVGVNFIEVYQRTGLYPVPMPATPGGEAAGVVEAVGEGVAGFRPGDRVASMNVIGAYAEYGLVAANRLVRLPEGQHPSGAAVLLQGMTAQYLTTSTYPLKPGDTCLVQRGRGGTGSAPLPGRAEAQARVIGTVSTDERRFSPSPQARPTSSLHPGRLRCAHEEPYWRGGGAGGVRFVGAPPSFRLDCLAMRGMMVLFGQSSGR